MVKTLFRFIVLMHLIFFPLLGIEIEVQLQDEQVGENQPIPGLIKVKTDAEATIDDKSFYLGDNPIAVKEVQSGRERFVQIINGKKIEHDNRVTVYQFLAEGNQEGLHMLPPVKVKVDGKEYVSQQTSYTIRNGKQVSGFFIETAIEGPNPLYPGQKAVFVYRVYYQLPVDVVSEFLPMMFPERGFKPLSNAEFKEYKDRSYRVTEMRLEVEALEPGKFEFAPAVIEGFHYSKDFFGRKEYRQPRLRALGEEITVFVSPFPKKEQPPSFYGAVGNFQITGKLLGSPNILVGDKVALELNVSGNGDLSSVKAPDLLNLEGFKDNFRLSGAPEEEIGEGYKNFIITMRPVNEKVKEIPSISFASFDPVSGEYIVSGTQPIRIQVDPVKDLVKTNGLAITSKNVPSEKGEVEEVLAPIEPVPLEVISKEKAEQETLPKIEIWGIKQVELKRSILPEGPYFALALAAFWVFILISDQLIRLLFRLYIARYRVITSKGLFEKAKKEAKDFVQFSAWIKKALLLRLYEKGSIPAPNLAPDLLPREGIAGEIRSYLLELDAIKYGGEEKHSQQEMIEKGRSLFEKL